MSRTITELDLSMSEQEHVRNALHFLHVKLEGWNPVAKLLRFEETTIIKCANGARTVSASMAFRIARLVHIKVDDLLTGSFPERGICPRCGYYDAREDEISDDEER